MLQLLDLPDELLAMIPGHLHNIEDYMNVSSSCRRLKDVLENTSRNTILRLAAASSKVFFRPDPWFLVMATSKEMGQWGLKSLENTEALRFAMRKGIDSLSELCIANAGLTMDDIRRLHLARFDLINPISDMIDRMAGPLWYKTPNFWDGGVSEAYTVHCEPMRSLFQFIIYTELFGSTMKSCLQPHLSLPRYSLHARLDYIRYCIPEMVCYHGSPGLPWPQRDGPYATLDFHGDGVAMWHITKCGRWNRPWAAIRQEIGPDFKQEWKREMWKNAVQCQGLEGLQMLRPGGLELWRARLHEIRNQIDRLEESHRPASHTFGRRQNPAYDYPNLNCEVLVSVACMWQPFQVVDPWVETQRDCTKVFTEEELAARLEAHLRLT